MTYPRDARHAIQDLLVQLFVAVDQKDWPTAREILADTVYFDIQSLGGPEPGEVAGAEIVAGWEGGLADVDHVHHQVGNYLLDISHDRAEAHCYGTAYHHNTTDEGTTITTFVGTYDFELARSGDDWRVDLLRYNSKFIDTRPASG